MPRLGNRIPKYRRHKQSGQAIVTINGRDYLLGPYGTKASHLNYDRLVTEWLSSGRSSAFGTPEHALSVVELIVAYLEFARGYYGGGSRSEYANMRHALRPVRQLYGKSSALEFGPRQLKAVRQKFIESGWSRNYINQSVQRICRVFRWGVAEELIPPEVAQGLASVPGLRRGHTSARETKRVRPVSAAIVAATISHLAPVVRSMVELQQLTGMRPGELCILRPMDVDRDQDVWEYRPSTHKTVNHEHDRVIYLGARAQAILAPYLVRAPEDYCFSPAESERKRRALQHAARTTPLSYGNRPGTNRTKKPKRTSGARYTPQSYLVAVRRACDKAFPVPAEIRHDPSAVKKWRVEHRWSPNRLRHSLATLVRRDYGIEAARILLGHSQTNMTGHYAEQDRQHAIEVVRKIG